MTHRIAEEGEQCQRCGRVGEDRRTLYMACFYAMHEFDVPFTQVQITGTVQRHTHDETMTFGGVGRPHRFARYEDVDPAAEPQKRGFYTLRVCKSCRAEWMQAIETWFRLGRAVRRDAEDDDPGEPNYIAPDGTPGYVWVRRGGATVLATPEEIRAMEERGGDVAYSPAGEGA